MEREDTQLRCYVCGEPAIWLVRVAGEDEQLYEEAVCEKHAHGHWRSALLAVVELRQPGQPPG